MLKSAASKVMWVGRATVFLLGLAVMLAVLFGIASTAFAHKGGKGFFHLAHKNVASKVSTLVMKGDGPALSLKVQSGPPLAVNSSDKVENLNAALLDGKSATDFAPKAAEPWHEVGQPNEPDFQNGWANGGGAPGGSTAAFYKDPYGVVHLKGQVINGGFPTPSTIFSLPCGYGPARTEWHATYSRGADGSEPPSRVDIKVSPCGGDLYSADVVAARGWAMPFSIDGITFRAAGS